MSKINVISLNCDGLRSHNKKQNLCTEIKRLKPQIFMLIDTRFNEEHERIFKNLLPEYRIFSSLVTESARGVSILLSKNIDIEVLDSESDDIGNLLILKVKYESKYLVLCAHYGLSDRDRPEIIENLFTKLLSLGTQNILVGGDWNLTLNFNIDNQGYNEPGKPRSARRLKELMGIHLFKDVYSSMWNGLWGVMIWENK